MKQQDIDRFWSKVDTSGECWLWLGTVSNGHCVMSIGQSAKYAVRIAWELDHGEPPPARIDLRRTCSTPLCIRPDHRQPRIARTPPVVRTPRVRSFAGMPETPGIYYILNQINHRIYVGETFNIQYRMRTHLTELRSNAHHNKQLQHDWQQYGADAFIFDILTEAPHASYQERQRNETLFIRAYQSFNPYFGYNSSALYERRCRQFEL